jgi:uncharacterized membrane protein
MTRKFKIAFLVSLVLNVLLVGVILGHLPRGLDARTARHGRFEEALQKLPEPAQSRLRGHFAEIRAVADELRKDADTSRAQALRVLSAEPFDEAGYDREVRKMEELRSEMFRRIGARIKQAAKELSPEERRMLAELLRRPPRPAGS